ncbi:hypothetical protein D3C72_501750 [compost metagenome]
MHERIHKTPADGGIKHLRLTLERRGRFAHHERRAGHGLHATGDQQIRIARFNRPSGKTDGVKSGTAQTVDRRAGHRLRESGQQRCHARHVTVVFSGLICTAEDHIVNTFSVQVRIARQQRTQRHSRQIVGAYTRQCTAITPHRGTNTITDKCITHQASPVTLPPMRCDLPRNKATVFCCWLVISMSYTPVSLP